MQTIKKKKYATKEQQEQRIMSLVQRISEYLSAHRKVFLIAASVIIVALVFTAGYAIMRSMQERKAAPLVAAAYEYYSPVGGTTADNQKALALFRTVQKEYSSTMSGAIAQYYVGNCLGNLGQADEAIKAYQQFVKTYSNKKFLLGLVYQRMGYEYLELGKQTEAIQSFEQAETLLGPGVSTFELAKLYEATGNIPQAQKSYKLIMEKLSGTSWAREATSKVQKIASIPFSGVAKEVK